MRKWYEVGMNVKGTPLLTVPEALVRVLGTLLVLVPLLPVRVPLKSSLNSS